MNAADFTFGVEIECILTAAAVTNHRIVIGPRRNGRQLPMPLFPLGWKAERDGSVGGIGIACEIVSPKLQGAAGFTQMLQVLATLRELGTTVNASCGFHVHVGWPAGTDFRKMGDLLCLMANLEKAFYASTGTKARERGDFAKSIKGALKGSVKHIERGRTGPVISERDGRYYSLNLKNVLEGRMPTCEFRVFGGTLNGTKAASYVMMCLAVVEKAISMKRRTTWNTFAMNGDGTTSVPTLSGREEMMRFFFQVGWTKGRVDKVYGDVGYEGRPSIDQIKRELVRLAEKYDASL